MKIELTSNYKDSLEYCAEKFNLDPEEIKEVQLVLWPAWHITADLDLEDLKTMLFDNMFEITLTEP